MTEDTSWFGDIDPDDNHREIEAWEEADAILAADGMSEEERHELWRALDPDTEALDWHAELVKHGLSPEAAQEYMRKVREYLDG